MRKGERIPIWAVTFLDHHEMKGAVPREWHEDPVSGFARITLWGRIVEENARYFVVETVHTDDPEGDYVSTRPVRNFWFVVKGAVLSKTRVGEWKHP